MWSSVLFVCGQTSVRPVFRNVFGRHFQVTMALFLCATMHQGDERFSVQTRGKQCAFMSLAAVITTQNNPVMIDWSTTTFDNVLSQGDQMYLKALNRGLIVLEQGVEFLSIDNLPKVVSISSCSSIFSYDIIDTVNLQPQPVVYEESIIPATMINSDPSLRAQNNNLPIVVEPIEAPNNSNLPIVVEPIEAQNDNDLPIEAQNDNDLPIEAQNNNDLPIEAQNNNDLPIEDQDNNDLPIEAQSNNDMPIEAQNNNDLPIEAQSNNDLLIVVEPTEARNNDNLPVSIEPNQAKNENQILFINYGNEHQGLVIMEGEIESHYNIHTALLNTFFNDSYAILILEGYMMALIKQTEFFYLIDSHARGFNGMPNPNGTAVVMKFANILELEEYLYCLAVALHTNLFEIVPLHFHKCGVLQKAECVEDQDYQKKRWSGETKHDKQLQLKNANVYKKDRSQTKLTVIDKLDFKK